MYNDDDDDDDDQTRDERIVFFVVVGDLALSEFPRRNGMETKMEMEGGRAESRGD